MKIIENEYFYMGGIMDKICLVYGGDSNENEISILTALKVQGELEKFSYPYMMVYLDHNGNFYNGTGLLHKNNYAQKAHFKKGEFHQLNGKYYFQNKMKKHYFDMVLLLCHGSNCEDGTLGGYFDTLKIPCIYPGLSVSSLVQDKANFKRVLDSLNIPQVKYQILSKEEYFGDFKMNEFLNLRYPIIVKPSHQGSSIGVNKVIDEQGLSLAIIDAFRYDDEIVLEEAVTNLKEINISIMKKENEIFVSDLERVNDKNDILTFYDKYDNYTFSESHIIPADIDKKVAKKIAFTAKKVYKTLNIKSVVRFDFLYDYEKSNVYLNEINAIPGSLSYYLYESKGMRLYDLIMALVDQYKLDKIEKDKLITKYNDGFLEKLKEK